MAFEREYHPNLRLTLAEKRDLLRHAVVIWMFDGGTLVGETYGIALDGRFEAPPGCPADPQAIYCYSTTVLRRYKNQGYGRILKAAFIGRVSRDFRRLYGHARSACRNLTGASALCVLTRSKPFLFISQRPHRIDPASAQRRHIARRACNQNQAERRH